MASLIEEALDALEAGIAKLRSALEPKTVPVENGTSTTPVDTAAADEVQSESEVAVDDSSDPAADTTETATETPAAATAESPAEGPATDPAGPAAGDVPEQPQGTPVDDEAAEIAAAEH